MVKHALLLSEPTNFAVVQLPERQFPGVVFQGDTLNALVQELVLMDRCLLNRDFEELKDLIDSIVTRLSEVRSRYERVCKENEISLPYFQK